MSLHKKIIRHIFNREWYRQRFDGSPLYLGFIAEAELARERRKPKGAEARVRVSFVKDRKADWYLDMADIKRGAAALTRLARAHPDVSKKLLKAWQTDEARFDKFFKAHAHDDFSRLSDRFLLALYRQYYRLAIRRFTSSAVIDHFALGTDVEIATLLRQEVGPLKSESEFTKIFSTATAPVRQSFINRAETELLCLARARPLDKVALARHQRRYFWIKNNYVTAQVLTAADFRKEIEVWRRSGADLDTAYRRLREAPRRNRIAKQALFRRYNFSPFLRRLLKIYEDFTWWQDERKRATHLNIHLGTKILGAMSQRQALDTELTKYLVPSEVAVWFTQDQPSAAELAQRRRGCAVVWWLGGHTVATGAAVERFKKIMFPAARRDEVRDLRGLAASVGRATGPVKVITSVQDIGKVKPGDILVAVMTRPDYIAGLKKAAAIVTNEGGITSHAAIVSRELGIPCVIGTKIATEVLKDGMQVEVNANHGVVTVK